MSGTDLDLAGPLRDAILAIPEAVALIDQWKGEPAIFTRRPAPADAPEKLIIVNPPTAITDEDGLTSDRPLVLVDLCAYGPQPEALRDIEAVGYHLRRHFHREKFSLIPVGYSVTDVRAAGPAPAPVDDEATVGRMVTLTIRLRRE